MNLKQARLKYWIIIILLSASVIAAYSMPVLQYRGAGFISKLDMPLTVNNWHGTDVSGEMNLDFDKNWNKFISEFKIIKYVNTKGEKLLFIVLDAGNFHHPNVCFTAAGFKIKELDDTELNVAGQNIKAHTLKTKKDADSNLSLYWIIIDKKIAHNWIEQKFKQLYFSLFNRSKVGLMVRIDVQSNEDKTEDNITLAKQFINDLSTTIPKDKADYIFGIK